MQNKTMEKYFFFGLLLATLGFTFLILRPFWVVLMLGVSFSVVLYPVYAWLKRGRMPNSLAALITLLFFIVLLCIPIFGIGSIIFKQSQNLYHSVVTNGDPNPFLNKMETKINNVLPDGINFDIHDKVSGVVTFITSNVGSIFNTTLTVLFSFVLLLLSIFYFLKDGQKWKQSLLTLSPLST